MNEHPDQATSEAVDSWLKERTRLGVEIAKVEIPWRYLIVIAILVILARLALK
jgi:hypothetical protein